MALLGVQAPRLSHVPDGDTARGDKAVEFARWCGMTLYPWQEELLRDMCRTAADGVWAAREVVVSLARQNGKGEVLVARELAGIFLFGEKSIFHSAHFMDTAIDAQKRLWEIIEASEDLMYWWEGSEFDGVPVKRTGNGKESIEFPNGAMIYFRTRTKKTGRGLSVDLLILDECFDLPKETHASLSKLIRAKQRAQAVYISSPVNRMEHHHGAVFSAKRWAGVAGAKRVLFKEWSPGEDDDPFDQGTWARCNPSMVDEGFGAQLSDIEADAEAAKNSEVLLEAFLVETLGKGDWYPRDGESEQRELLTDLQKWDKAHGTPMAPSDSCVGISVSPAGDDVAFVAAIRDGDKAFLSLSPLSEFERASTLKAVERAVSNNDPLGVVIDPIGQASTLLGGLEKQGVDPLQLSGSKVSAAYELFIRLVRECRIIHDGNPRWIEAWQVAEEKPGKYRCLYQNDPKVVPLVAASFAVWGLQELEIPEQVQVKKKTMFVGKAKPVKAGRRAELIDF